MVPHSVRWIDGVAARIGLPVFQKSLLLINEIGDWLAMKRETAFVDHYQIEIE